jgi:UTP--glucose-1-phosphate uridylyltransferase
MSPPDISVRKVVLPSAGLGTRLLPITKEFPKEMLPIFARDHDRELRLLPLLQAVFEQLYNVGFREFCFVVGREKRAIEDHFTPDHGFLRKLRSKSRNDQLESMKRFYDMIVESRIIWINQPEPRGFGDAVLKAEPFVGNDLFLCHAGDTYITSRRNRHVRALLDLCEKDGCDAAFIAQRVKHPKGYGIVEGMRTARRIYNVERVVEKPEKPRSDIAIMPLYVFRPVVFRALRKIRPGFDGELQLTDAIQRLIDWKSKVFAYLLGPDDIRLDIGSPETWWEALALSRSRV